MIKEKKEEEESDKNSSKYQMLRQILIYKMKYGIKKSYGRRSRKPTSEILHPVLGVK